MRYTRVITTKTPLVQARFTIKQMLRDFAMSPSALQGSGTNSIEKQTTDASRSNAVTNTTNDSLNKFREVQKVANIDNAIDLRKRVKDSKKAIKTPILPIALKESIRNEENKNKISPLI